VGGKVTREVVSSSSLARRGIIMAHEAREASIDEICDTNGAISVALIDEFSLTRECIFTSLQKMCKQFKINSFATCEEYLRSTDNYHLALYHVHSRNQNNNNNHEKRAPVKKIRQLAPVIILSDIDRIDYIVAAFESGARGYIPTTNTTLGLMIEIMRLVRAGGTFVPPSSLSVGITTPHQGETAEVKAGKTYVRPSGLSHSRGTQQDETAGAIPTNELTPRQLAVLGQLKLGKTNRLIARELGVTESTVKAHLRNIMKKMRVINRTEAVSRAYELEIKGARPTD
jgi:DNA-binding NarL/FixJ family response regulator